jgi:hypothetical protein
MKSFNSFIDFLTEEDVADAATTITLVKMLERFFPMLKSNADGDVVLDANDSIYTLRKSENNTVLVEVLDKVKKKIVDEFIVKQKPYVDRIIKVIDRVINKGISIR